MQPSGNPVQFAQTRLGSVLSGKWRLERVLGIGGVATVYLATHRNHSRAALKLLHPEQAHNSDVRERFVHEGYAANSIDHPGVVKVLDDDVTADGVPYLVMELLDGETLEERADRLGNRLPPGEVLALADQLLDVLAMAHAKNVIHRDLKPDNLFLNQDGRLKVLDFGIARLSHGVRGREVTAVGALLGTPAFMPPEQARSRWEEVDARSDLYSVGATMFNLLTGRLVREAETLTEQLALAIHEPAPKLASIDPTQHLAVCEVVDRALAYERAGRFPNARAFQVEVRRVRELVPPPATPSVSPSGSTSAKPVYEQRTLLESGSQRDGAPPPQRDKRRSPAIWRGIAALLLLLLTLMGGFAISTWRSLRVDAKHAPPPQVEVMTPTHGADRAPPEKPAESALPFSPPAPPASTPEGSAAGRSSPPAAKSPPRVARAPADAPAPSPSPSPPVVAAPTVDDPLSKRY